LVPVVGLLYTDIMRQWSDLLYRYPSNFRQLHTEAK